MEAERRGRGDLKQQVLSVLLAADKAMTPGQVRDAIDADVAYTTVMTVLNRLSEQGLAARRRTGRAYAYTAVVDRAEVTAHRCNAFWRPATTGSPCSASFSACSATTTNGR